VKKEINIADELLYWAMAILLIGIIMCVFLKMAF
jgi:hypothetical protein